MRACVLVSLAACGGGPSLEDVEPSTRIVSSNCQLLGDTDITVDISYDTELAVGQAWESVVIVGANFMTGEDEFFSCNAWTPTGAGASAKGCQRDTDAQPANQTVTHTYSASFQSLSPPVNVMIIANTFSSPGGFGLGSGDNENIDCF